MQEISIFWFRRDLRLEDNKGLYNALKNSHVPVLAIFIFDTDILDHLPKNDARLSFIIKCLNGLNKDLKAHKTAIQCFKGKPVEVFSNIFKKYRVKKVFTNTDYEPYARERDQKIAALCQKNESSFCSSKDHVIFEKEEVVKNDNTPYLVYTPYKKKWLKTLEAQNEVLTHYPSTRFLDQLLPITTTIPTHDEMGFEKSAIEVQDFNVQTSLIANYNTTRDFPHLKEGTSKLGPHLRFGTVSCREMVKKGLQAEEQTFLSEIIWRDFFTQILWHFPHTLSKAFKPKYDAIQWRNNKEEFEKWKAGKTGYPLVDAGMRELNATGYMHNRVRMLVGSFLCKHLLIDWRWGEAYFAEKLLDYECASNIGNWQWVAGTGVDAAPYFRIFNPTTQIKKFDPKGSYIKKWVKDLNEFSYPKPIVEHKIARERCLEVYKAAL